MGKQSVGGAIVSIVGVIFVLALMVYTALRTLDLLQTLLPDSLKALSILALLAFDGGLCYWVMSFLYGSHGTYQRALAGLGVVLSIVAVLVGFTADTFLVSAAKGLTTFSPEAINTTVWTTCIVIGLQVVLGIAHIMCSPSNLARIRDENARDQISISMNKRIAIAASTMSDHAAKYAAERWIQEECIRLGIPAPEGLPEYVAPVVEAKPTLIEQFTTAFLKLRSLNPKQVEKTNGHKQLPQPTVPLGVETEVRESSSN